MLRCPRHAVLRDRFLHYGTLYDMLYPIYYAKCYLVGYKLDFMLRRAMIRYAMLRYAIATLRYVRCCYAMLRCAAYAKRELCHMCYLHVRYVWYLSISPFGDWKENMPRKK